jgi:asparagine synthase (glutamine-hydrolysing)
MCGIWGIAAFDGAPARLDAVRAITPVLRHRGPDDTGAAAIGSAAFGHTRLSILGPAEPEAVQPARDAQCMLSFNGEIYNFQDLAKSLRGEGIPVRGRSDTEVLFKALRHWGVEKTLKRIDGMYAFAWFDDAIGRLALCRDPLGEKFLYWGRNGEALAFASEIKGVLATGIADGRPNLARIDDYFFTGKINGAATFFEQVHEVEPGTWIDVDTNTGSVRTYRHWSLTDIPDGDRRDADQVFADLFTRAVHSRRISDVPLGVLLSGGIDSNALTRTLVEDDPARGIDLYFADNRNAEMSERPAMSEFLRHLSGDFPAASVRLHDNILEYDNYHTRMRHLTWHYDEPLQFMNSPLLGGLCDMARSDGLKVLLSGEGSDEILHGYVRFGRTTEELGDSPSPADILAHLYFGGGMHSVATVRSLCGSAGDGAENTEAWRWLEGTIGDHDTGRLQLLFSQRYRLQTLLQRQDRIGMASGIEIRVPFLAPWLVAAMNAFPVSDLYDGASGVTKLPLRKAMQGRLPELILTKKKDGFPSDMHVWLREERMQRLLTGMVEASDSFSASYLNMDTIRSVIESHFAGRQRFDVLIWLLYSLETWHAVFAGQGALAPREAAGVH